jgi:hypothetical protein
MLLLKTWKVFPLRWHVDSLKFRSALFEEFRMLQGIEIALIGKWMPPCGL